MRRSLLPVIVLAVLALAGCSGSDTPATPAPGGTATVEQPAQPEQPEQPEVPDLVGEWKQTNGTADSYQTATITADSITVDWVNEAESTKALYWAGTYEAPTSGEATFTWDSVNDTEQTERALLASDAPTKTFTYSDGVITYDVTAMGVTKTVELERQ